MEIWSEKGLEKAVGFATSMTERDHCGSWTQIVIEIIWVEGGSWNFTSKNIPFYAQFLRLNYN